MDAQNMEEYWTFDVEGRLNMYMVCLPCFSIDSSEWNLYIMFKK